MGAKAANVFSKHFRVTHANAQTHECLTFSYSDNLRTRHPPLKKKYARRVSYVEVTFLPDYVYFGYPGLDEPLLRVLWKLCLDAAMVTGLPVEFNGHRTRDLCLDKYVALYYPKMPCLKVSEDIVLVETGGAGPPCLSVPQVSFVNGICTSKGGVHVQAWQDALFSSLVRSFNVKHKSRDWPRVSARELYPFFCLFVRCNLPNPEFRSQVKDELSAPRPSARGLTPQEYDRIVKWKFHSKICALLERKSLAPAITQRSSLPANSSVWIKSGGSELGWYASWWSVHVVHHGRPVGQSVR